MPDKKDGVKPSSRFALFTELVCSLSPYKQITDTGLKPMRHIIMPSPANTTQKKPNTISSHKGPIK